MKLLLALFFLYMLPVAAPLAILLAAQTARQAAGQAAPSMQTAEFFDDYFDAPRPDGLRAAYADCPANERAADGRRRRTARCLGRLRPCA
eukprot:547597-Heterocapsa_arctica.AAC.1